MHGLFHFPAQPQKLKEFLNETNFLCFLKKIYPLEFPIFWNEALFDLLSQLFAPFGKFLMLIQNNPCAFSNPKPKTKKNCYIFSKNKILIFLNGC